MNKLILTLWIGALGFLLVENAGATDTQTDPARDIFVENSTTNFVITVKLAQKPKDKKAAFDVSAPSPGDYTLVCFIDGKVSNRMKFKAPGTFELNTRGMAPASYRITLQLIDSQGRVGRAAQNLELK